MRIASKVALSGVLAWGLLQAAAQQSAPPYTPASDAEKTAPALQLGDPVEVGNPIHTVDPIVPDEFRKKNGFAVLHGTITTDGSFNDLTSVDGNPTLAASAIAAVQQWSYSPCTLNGAPVQVPIYIAFNFNKGDVKSSVEADLPFPTAPKRPIEEQLAAGQLFRIGGGVTAPRVVNSPDPEFSGAAQVAKFSGVIVLGMIVEADGVPGDIWVKQKLGLGLDQKAIETVQQWKFKPATKSGQPVAVPISIEVSFHIY